MKRALFALGQIVATPRAFELMKAQGIDGLALLSRHVTGDWGDMGEEDKQVLYNDARYLRLCVLVFVT